MSFVVFDYTSSPIIHVYMNNTLESDDEFNRFLDEWLLVYSGKYPFVYVFHAENVGFIPIKYAFSVAAFIRRYRVQTEKYLQKSIIIVDNSYVRYMIDLIFYIQSPFSDVYVTKYPFLVDDLLKNDYRKSSFDYDFISSAARPFPFL